MSASGSSGPGLLIRAYMRPFIYYRFRVEPPGLPIADGVMRDEERVCDR
jgi:hypothetical protein